jgi:transposase-like protein
MSYRTQEEWAAIVEAFKQSGQTQTAWCKEYGIHPKTLGAHLRGRRIGQNQIKRGAEEWAVLIAQQKASGMNRMAWCREHGISSDSMTSAEKRINARDKNVSGPEWAELTLGAKAAAPPCQKGGTNCGVKICSGGFEIEFGSDYPVEKLATLIGRLVK